MMAEVQHYKNIKGQWEMAFTLHEHSVHIETMSTVSMQHYEASMTNQSIKADKNFQFLFTNLVELFKFLQCSFADLQVSNTQIKMEIQVPIGKLKRKIELKIPLIKKQVQESRLRDIKLRKMQEQIEFLKEESARLKAKTQVFSQQSKKTLEAMKRFQRTLSAKDQVINSIFQELKEIRAWKQEKQDKNALKGIKNFVADPLNPQNSKFIQMGNRFKKKSAGNTWDLLICKHQVQKNSVYHYNIRQIKAGPGGSFMYGIGTANLRGVMRAQDSKQFIGYYQNTGNVYDRGQSRKGGPKIKDGDIIGIEIDTINWFISWTIEGVMEAEVAISGQLRTKQIYLALVIFNDESQLQFV